MENSLVGIRRSQSLLKVIEIVQPVSRNSEENLCDTQFQIWLRRGDLFERNDGSQHVCFHDREEQCAVVAEILIDRTGGISYCRCATRNQIFRASPAP